MRYFSIIWSGYGSIPKRNTQISVETQTFGGHTGDASGDKDNKKYSNIQNRTLEYSLIKVALLTFLEKYSEIIFLTQYPHAESNLR